MNDGVKVKGFFRVQIKDSDGKLKGDSGWKPNTFTNLGLQNYVAGSLYGAVGSKQVGYCAIGTGGAPATDATTLPGEVMSSTQRVTVSKDFSSRTVSNGSCTVWFYATFASGFITGAGSNIANIGLYATNEAADTIMAGNTYSSSACASNQAVNVTYQIQLG